jgi:1,4-alpha-glucan branching enzyme
MLRSHDMPFGAALGTAGQTRFSLWAPQQEQVSLVLSGQGDERLPMERGDDGWHLALTDRARPGSR